ncbi:hypothetical protein Hdeb2414_s0425g00890931 [Helianthus debilis subsp. tardiflorus]
MRGFVPIPKNKRRTNKNNKEERKLLHFQPNMFIIQARSGLNRRLKWAIGI